MKNKTNIKTIDKDTIQGLTQEVTFSGDQMDWAGNKPPGSLGKLIILDFSLEQLRGGVTPLMEIK